MKKSHILPLILPLALATGLLLTLGIGQAQKEPGGDTIKALLVTGEGYHDYEKQKVIISEGLKTRLPIEWTIIHDKNAEDAKANLSKEGWADPYDIVVYNICHAKETDKAFVDKLVEVHRAGKPAVALHCTMHSYHWKIAAEEEQEKSWVQFLGVESRNHGPKAQIKLTKAEGVDHPAIASLPEEGWTTPQGELYNVNRVLDTVTVLAYGDNGKVAEPQVSVWVNQFGEGKVFATTIGHHNETMEAKEYLDLLADGIRWAVSEAEVPAKKE